MYDKICLTTLYNGAYNWSLTSDVAWSVGTLIYTSFTRSSYIKRRRVRILPVLFSIGKLVRTRVFQRIHRLRCPARRCCFFSLETHFLEVMFRVELLCQCSVCLAQDRSLRSCVRSILLLVLYMVIDLVVQLQAIFFRHPMKQADRGGSTLSCPRVSRLEAGGS